MWESSFRAVKAAAKIYSAPWCESLHPRAKIRITPCTMVQRFTPHHERWCRDSLRTVNDGAEIHSVPRTMVQSFILHHERWCRDSLRTMNDGADIHSCYEWLRIDSIFAIKSNAKSNASAQSHWFWHKPMLNRLELQIKRKKWFQIILKCMNKKEKQWWGWTVTGVSRFSDHFPGDHWNMI